MPQLKAHLVDLDVELLAYPRDILQLLLSLSLKLLLLSWIIWRIRLG